MDSCLINPFELLGVTPNSDMSKVKSSYYGLSLICHPDKGGKASDFDIVHNAYLYVKNQLDSRIENTELAYATLENDFKIFCDEQVNKPPTFHQIFVENNEEAKRFHQVFEEQRTTDSTQSYGNPFSLTQGYGDTMDAPDIGGIDTHLVVPTQKTKVSYSQEIIRYTDPTSEADTYYGSHHRFDEAGMEVNDYSQKCDGLSMSDYCIAHSEPLPYELLKSQHTNPYHNNKSVDHNLELLRQHRML